MEQERQRHDLEAIKETLGVLGGREQLQREIDARLEQRAFHDERGTAAVRRYRTGKNNGRIDDGSQGDDAPARTGNAAEPCTSCRGEPA